MADKKPETPKEPQLVRRIDRNTVAGTSDAVLKIAMKDETKTHFLYRVGGTAAGYVPGESKFGEWKKLVGRFKAVNFNNDVFVAGAAFLPGDIAESVAAKLQGETESVSFLYDIFVRYDSQLGPKYGYICEPVRKPEEGDPLDLLFADVRPMPMLADQSK